MVEVSIALAPLAMGAPLAAARWAQVQARDTGQPPCEQLAAAASSCQTSSPHCEHAAASSLSREQADPALPPGSTSRRWRLLTPRRAPGRACEGGCDRLFGDAWTFHVSSRLRHLRGGDSLVPRFAYGSVLLPPRSPARPAACAIALSRRTAAHHSMTLQVERPLPQILNDVRVLVPRDHEPARHLSGYS